MCACNGTGGINIEHSWGASFHPCPDTNCEFDRSESDRKYEEWKKKVEAILNGKSKTDERASKCD